MKKKGSAYIVLAIAFALVQVVAFALPVAQTASFWIAYAFTTIAFAAQIGVWHVSFKGKDKPKSKFLGISVLSVGIAYLVIQTLAFAAVLLFPTVSPRITVIVCAVILGGSLMCLIGTDVARKEIERADETIGKKTFFIKSLQTDIELLAQRETDAATKDALNKLAQKIRFSDPMSSDELSELEAQITETVNELKAAEEKAACIAALDSLIDERNKKAKGFK